MMKPFSWIRFVNSGKRRKPAQANSAMETLETRVLLAADLAAIVDNFEPDADSGDDQHSSEADSTATELDLDGTPIYSHIDEAGDVDVFQITPTADGTLTLTGATVELDEGPDDDGGMDDEHEECAPDSELGEDPHGETTEDATPLEFEGGWVTGWSYIDEAGDVDVFSFTAEATTTLDIFSMNLESFDEDINVEVLDADGEVISEVDWGYGSVDVVEDGEYFVRVSGMAEDSTGEYFFELIDCPDHDGEDTGDWESPYTPDSEKGEDPHGDALDETATEIVSGGGGTARNSYVDTPDDVDVFRFTPESDAEVSFHIWMSGDSDMWSVGNVGAIELVNGSGEVLDSAEGSWGLFSAEVTGGEEYFVRVSSVGDETGFYTLSVQEIETVEWDFSSIWDWDLQWDTDWDGSVWDDSDWGGFEWDLNWGTVQTIDFDADTASQNFSPTAATFEILSSDGEVIGMTSEEGVVSIDVTADETYYVRVAGADSEFTGTYVADLAFDETETMEVELPETEETVTVTVNERRVIMRVGDEIVDRMKLDDTEKVMIVGTNKADDVIVRVNDSSDELEMIEVDANRGNDRIRIKAKEDAFEGELRVDGNRGRDRLIAKDSEIPVEMHGGAGSDTLTGTAENDILCGDGGQDEIRGRGGKDFIEGGNGDDSLMGGRGNDVLTGGRGEDMIDGQGGRDTLMEMIDVDGALMDDSLQVAEVMDQLFRIERTYMDGEGEVDMTQFAGTVATDRVFTRLMDELF